MRICRKNQLRSSWAVRYFFLGDTLFFPERYATDAWGVRCRYRAVRRSFLGSTLLIPRRYAIDETPIGESFMDGTLLVARAQDQFSGGYAIYFWARSTSIVATTSHPWRVPIGFMDGTLFALVPYFNRCPGGEYAFFTNVVEGAFCELRHNGVLGSSGKPRSNTYGRPE
jgi:hypothetical protein